MTKQIHIMTDIETLGIRDDATIIQIAAIAFDLQTGAHYDQFNMIADVSKNEEMFVDGGTLQWWLNTDAELFKHLITNGTVSSNKLIVQFHDWINGLSDNPDDELHLWGNGILFDNNKIKYQMERNRLDYPIHFKKDRDVRTIVHLAGDKLGITERQLKDSIPSDDIREHDAIDDVIYQIRMVKYCYDIVMN